MHLPWDKTSLGGQATENAVAQPFPKCHSFAFRSNVSCITKSHPFRERINDPKRLQKSRPARMSSFGRRGSYPIQSSEYTPSVTTAHTLSVLDQNAPLPTSIRALKDSRVTQEHQRTVVICLDGTGDRFDNDNSNVVHFVSCLKKHTPDQQVTYYQSGIGTYDKGGLKNGFGAAMDMAVGSGLGIHIKDAYRFLMQNYRDGDKICLFGFSRGAYTVRCLAGMLHKVGLLPASNGAQVNFAYDFYKDDSPNGWKMSAQFKRTFCTNVDVYFVGVWDCVASVGFIPRKLPFSKSPTNSIHYFRHAIALDEHRSKFKVCQWEQQNPDAGAVAKRVAARKGRHGGMSNGDAHPNGHGLRRTETAIEQEKLEAYFDEFNTGLRKRIDTDALEVWFMGAHADIGGGAVANDVRHRLSHIPLRWMLRQCFECNTGILFDTGSLIEQGLDVHSLYPLYQPPSQPACGPPPALLDIHKNDKVPPLRWRRAMFSIGDDTVANDIFGIENRDSRHLALLSEGTEDHFDAMAPVNDQLVLAKGWWVLEFWPVKMRVLARNGIEWEKKVRWNLGRYRAVRETEPKMHWTVQHMMDEGKYTVKGRVHRDNSWQIVA
ncbi:hypothetical protein K458DRAFT_352677 [Lentithecium fluviatile CBS 122367]|uniref:T6SS Phospholipase effector Tle1-like catalytic domain-containing protein n=1 Tax=Lentithecium fluviatile CBS 122367 TaxID=1168545 RepID=A0A6G1ICK6_9PLEO|nr:hypothetical protein K458DRAFT_352677 [Lentithecium fluviatile CBS 122367]